MNKDSVRNLFLFEPKKAGFVLERCAQVIIKSKNISKKNKKYCRNILRLFIILFFLLAITPGARADSILFFYNEKNKTPKIISDPNEIEEAVEFASSITGVRKDFLMGMLVVESDLGRNPGKCTYKEVEEGAQRAHENGKLSKRAWKTFQERRKTIKDIAGGLGYDHEKLRVSCNPEGVYYGTGGAMGIPQFMPDTWLEYKDRISEIVGKKNPDPWDPRDGAVAMALKLSDVYGVTEHDEYAEKNAAKMYLSGTTSWEYNWYANEIFYWSRNYRKLYG